MTNRTTALVSGRAALILTVLLVSACGSSAPAVVKATSGHEATIANTCQQVSAVLADGPDSDADPVGYAEAQVIPLRRLNVPNQTLRGVVSQLASAYQKFFVSNGKSSTAKEAVAVATKKLNSLCPGAAS
jgi:predicted component of type VI protein secretion system